ncbi:MAG: FAD:protein FMN transferase [Spirochaetales bacterium]|nr:FAD:protein FMN transferase [Spirochaetales bacterium]
MKTKTIIIFIFSAILLLSCMPSRYSETRLSITGESTIPVTIIIYTGNQPDWDGIFTFLESRARLYDYRVQGSPVQELNSSFKAQLPEDVFRTLETALDIAEKSRGVFDPTILPLIQLWDFEDSPQLPDPGDISSAKSFVNYTKITLYGNNTVSIPEKYGLDLGGIAKGALVDSLADYFHTLGYENFLIEAGGDIILSGLKPGNEKWIVGIRHPREITSRIGELTLGIPDNRIAIVTSGDYERYFEQDGIRYHHIIDPRTGYPARDAVSVTVIAPNCAIADALATAAFVLGKKEGIAFLEKEKDTEGLIVYEEDGYLKTAMTEGFSLFVNRIAF